MIWSFVTVFCYTISSLGDKFISKKMKCNPAEFAFFVAVATTIWMGILIPFTGWDYEINKTNLLLTGGLIVWKLIEFYSSAILLKTISAYELKAWLGINIVVSYLYNVYNDIYAMNLFIILFSFVLFGGIILIVSEQKGQIKKTILLCIVFIISKFGYGLQIGMLSKECSSVSVLFIVMIFVALIQLPAVKIKNIMAKEGKQIGFLTRLPNAAGLITEAMAAQANIFLYAMIQPLQLVVLFVVSLKKKEPMGKKKLLGSILCIASVCAITLLIFLHKK